MSQNVDGINLFGKLLNIAYFKHCNCGISKQIVSKILVAQTFQILELYTFLGFERMF